MPADPGWIKYAVGCEYISGNRASYTVNTGMLPGVRQEMTQRETYMRAPAARSATPPESAAAQVSRDLIEALGAHGGIVCVSGAGGKKTVMYRIAAAHPGRIGMTSTVHMHPYDAAVVDRVIISDGDLRSGVSKAADARVLAFARSPARPNRLGGVDPDQVAGVFMQSHLDLCLVKADGARGRWIKAPAPYEPVIPAGADRVIYVVSARVLGEPLSDRVAHRPARVAEVVGVRIGEAIEPEHLAHLLASPQGARHGLGNAPLTPVINMVDDQRLLELARLSAHRALDLTDAFDEVVLTRLKGDGYVEVVSR